MNIYLKRKREQAEAVKKTIEGLQTRAAEENRDLTEDELRSVTEQSETYKTLVAEIETLSDVETRSQKVAELASQVHDTSGGDGDGGRERTTSNASAKDRDPGHYRSVQEGGAHSFFSDLYRAKTFGDENAMKRLAEHNRALSTGGEGTGVVPPRWLTEEFETLPREGRPLAMAVRNIPLGDDPRPITIPKQTAGTDSVVGEQADENDPVTGTDAWDSDVDTITPKPTSGKQTVSRQMVDMSSPAIDQLIYGDLLDVYDTKVEVKVCGAVRGVGTALTATGTQFADMSTAETNGYDLAVNASVAVRQARKRRATILAVEVGTWGRYKKLKDADGRPLIPASTAGPMNVIGVGSVNVDGIIDDLGIVATDGLDAGVADQEDAAALRAFDVLLFESNMLRFRFEEQAGPESIVLGIWGYAAVHVRHGTKAVKRIQIDTSL